MLGALNDWIIVPWSLDDEPPVNEGNILSSLWNDEVIHEWGLQGPFFMMKGAAVREAVTLWSWQPRAPLILSSPNTGTGP